MHVMAQNNAHYCQINRQTSFNESSLCCLPTGVSNQSELQRGGAWDMYMRSGVTCFNSCPNPDLETVSPSLGTGLDRISQGHFTTFSMASLSHAAFQLPILHGPSEFIPSPCQNVCPHCNKLIVHEVWDNSAYLVTGSRRAFLCWQSWMLLQIPSRHAAYKLTIEKQRSGISVRRVLSRLAILLFLPLMQQPSAEMLGTSGLLTAL